MLQKNQRISSASDQLICTDGAKFSLRGHLDRQKSGFRKISSEINLKYRGYGNPMFETVAEIYYNSIKIGELEAHPRSLLAEDTILLSVDNKIQYQKGWTAYIKSVCDQMNFSFMHINRLDIAIDQPDENQFNFIQKLIAGSIKQVGSTSYNCRYEGTDETTGAAKLTYFTFGSRSSDKYMRAYYKRQELAVSNKNYIAEFWAHNNLRVGEDQEVCRFEMVLKRDELKKYIESDLSAPITFDNLHLLESPEFLATLFNTAKNGFFEFVSRASFNRTGNVTRCKRLKILDLSNICTRLLDKVKSKATSMIYNAKMSIKLLYMLHCKTGEDLHYLHVNEIIKNFNLGRWFEANVERFYREFSVKMRGDNFEYLKNFTSTPEFEQAKIWQLHNFTL